MPMVPRLATGATTPMPRIPAPLTAITVLAGSRAASLSELAPGTVGGAAALATADTVIAAAMDTAADTDIVAHTADAHLTAVDTAVALHPGPSTAAAMSTVDLVAAPAAASVEAVASTVAAVADSTAVVVDTGKF
jgi:hypothetical protein